MDLMTLDDTSHQPAKLVQKYDSLIWTERFNTVGGFQLMSGDVQYFMDLLPEGTLLTLRDTNEVMIVENHNIGRKKNEPTMLTITGRTCESILDRRVASNAVSGGTADWAVAVKTPSDAAYFAIHKIVVDGILDANDIFDPAEFVFPTPADYLTGTGPTKNFSIERGSLLSSVLTLLQSEAQADPTTSPATPAVVPHGIRAVRPNFAGTAIAIEIFKGTDLSGTVYFDAKREQLDDGSYLFSKVGSATTAYVTGPSSALKINKGAGPLTGLDRRVILVDASSSGITDAVTLGELGKSAMSEAHVTALFDGSINPDTSPYRYGVDYDLGDIVKLVGDYGLDERARVTEYIRSEDSQSGYRAYPTLTTVTT